MTARRIAILCLLLTGLGVMTAEAARSRRFVARLNLELIGPPVSPSRCAPPLVLVELEGEGRVNRLGAVTAEAITGGSGELAGATGEGTYSGIAVPEENRGFVLLRGRLTVP